MTWSEVPLRSLYQRVEKSGRPDLPLLSVYRDYGVIPREGREDNYNKPSANLSGYKIVQERDLVINKMKAWQGSLGVSDYDGIVSPAYFVGRPIGDADHRFLHHLLRSSPLIAEYGARSKGIRPSQWDLPWDEFASIKVRLPTSDIQRKLANYLDTETARIDALISKKRRMISILDERWRVWVRNLLGSLTCAVLPLKRHWRVIDCKHRTPVYVDEGYPVVSPGDAMPGRLDLSRAHRFVDEADYRDLAAGARRPTRGDIIYSRNASIGIASYVDTDTPFCMGQDVCLITSDNMDQLFLMYVLNSVGLDQLEIQKIGSTFSRVNISQIREILVPVPDRDEQQTLSRRIDLVALHLSRVYSVLEVQISLLHERRRILVAAVVTGEASVRTVVA
ncbi:MAG: hypothetical protein F4Z34_07615 [Acidimicrobiaceae bacterium]|nr:hypothetical protein [Acidimicrobiaceae bacterium]